MRSNALGPKLLLPGLLWLLVFVVLPLLIMVSISFARRLPGGLIEWTFTLENYARALDALYLVGPVANSLWLAALTTVGCFVLGYPLAYYIARRPPRWRALLLFLVVLPFLTNFLVRIYAWFILLRPEGWIAALVKPFGVEMALLGSPWGVLIGLVYGYLPFMVLPLYATLEKLDFTLVEAAHDLGATRWQSFWRVIFPLSRPGVIAGAILVFIPVLGEFLAPKLLGGGKVPMIGITIEEQFLGRVQNWPLGAAMAVGLMLLVSLVLVRYFKQLKEARWVS
ncbi:MAG: ABC transporter permease [Candidatus Bipolaricaulota bacterium]|nr:ABC transporter permease [Candidatus Bipolaricaulota bacterium]MCS7274629.1 ABC transporter permease [Candidatus Bipolaricaulota bacterium]MDW8110941.1 ABC transporter permease [Candidatus Bipolaricaulota bacterium]MDW8329099.1 ABC transporter permease [Candidatus Bipolaricaulota bacterium]